MPGRIRGGGSKGAKIKGRLRGPFFRGLIKERYFFFLAPPFFFEPPFFFAAMFYSPFSIIHGYAVKIKKTAVVDCIEIMKFEVKKKMMIVLIWKAIGKRILAPECVQRA